MTSAFMRMKPTLSYAAHNTRPLMAVRGRPDRRFEGHSAPARIGRGGSARERRAPNTGAEFPGHMALFCVP
jgi:hypothetical protein